MLYVCIPVHNEATTIGVLLWRIRTVLQEYTREYEVVVYDDGSTDETAEVLEPYRRVLPLTVLRAPRQRGTAAAVDALCRHVIGHTRYPRRDAVVLMQGDFTDRPEDLPELAKRFEGGADLVIGRRPASEEQPLAERRLRRLAPWVLRPFVRVADVEDLVTGFRLVRISVLRDLARARGDALLAAGEGWAATVDFALAVAPYARRVDVVDLPGRYDLRPRASRLDWWRELRGLAGYAWRARGRQVAAGERLGDRGPERPSERAPDRAPERAPDRGDVAVIGSVSALTLAEGGGAGGRSDEERGGRAGRDKRRGERPERPSRSERPADRPTDRPGAEPGRRKGAIKPRREGAGEPAALESVAQPRAPKPRPRRGEPSDGRPEQPPTVEVEAPTAAPAPGPAVVSRALRDVPSMSPETEGTEDAAGDLAEETVPEAGETTEAGRKRRARRRRRRSRSGGAAGGLEGASDESSEGCAGGEDGEGGESAPEREHHAAEVAGAADDDAGGGEEADGAAPGGKPARKRRRRRGRGRGERAEGGGDVSEGESGGTDAPSGVGQSTTGVGGVPPRAPEPDGVAD